MARIYIGNLPMDVSEKDIDDVFYKFGRIVDIDLKTPTRPPAFGFVTFQDARDADEAVRARYAMPLRRRLVYIISAWSRRVGVLEMLCSEISLPQRPMLWSPVFIIAN